MSKTAARFTKAELARALTVAKEAGGWAVEVQPDGTIRVVPYIIENESKIRKLDGKKRIVV
ncbi:MAG: hypothetical protein ABFD96_25295 [Armatimonadia bacterium]